MYRLQAIYNKVQKSETSNENVPILHFPNLMHNNNTISDLKIMQNLKC